ncbi:VOC family protein [Steroidobacter sp. S1-65]|uniref:VOC family protein n=1 Tax=Steroidobacter gossypii TaxID=2805490 RepID=A0ABS1X3M7_9GAMM|nr:VOC family protein [Steroidobacter gossypii]MBM0107802.1 VOC family protein [Steroidobacter gossypii]
MQIRHVVIKVDDQDKALAFYTSVLGFKKIADRGGRVRWLTVASGTGPKGVELVLEPNSPAPARAAQKALYDAVFPAAILSTNHIAGEYQRLKRLGVRFRGKPKKLGSSRFVFFDDTCGNFIVLLQREA